MTARKTASKSSSIANRAWQRMLSGRRLDLLDPSPLDIEIADIAHGLARVARWNGQTSGAHIFSVAQHTLLVEAVMREQMPRVDVKFRMAALLHDAPGLMLGPLDARPDLCLVVVNNDGGGIFSTLEQAAFPDAFERVFGTPHGADLAALAATAGLPYERLDSVARLPAALAGAGLRLVEVRTDRADSAKLRAALGEAAAAALSELTAR